jgi:hypothetical protein
MFLRGKRFEPPRAGIRAKALRSLMGSTAAPSSEYHNSPGHG